MHKITQFLLAAMTVSSINLSASHLLDDCSDPANWQFNKKPAKVVSFPEGKALQVDLPGKTERWKLSCVSGNFHLNNMKGISFEVKGNGEDFYAPVMIHGYGSNRGWDYTAYFQVKGKDWQTITIGFDRFTACNGNVYWDFNMPGTFGPGGIDGVSFGDRWYIGHCNRRLPKRTIYVRNIKMVSKVTPYISKTYPLKKVKTAIDKMKSGQKVSIICTGDSITAGTGVKDPDVNRYGVKLQNKLRKAFNNNNIDVEVVAVGGAKTFDLRVWAERDFAGKKPDLVTILIGYNDKSSRCTPYYYYHSLSRAIDRILNVTEGSPAILLLPPIPGQGSRYNMLDDYAELCKKVAIYHRFDYFEMAPAFKKLPPETFASYFKDMAHPNENGHEFIARLLTEYLTK